MFENPLALYWRIPDYHFLHLMYRSRFRNNHHIVLKYIILGSAVMIHRGRKCVVKIDLTSATIRVAVGTMIVSFKL